MKPPGLHNIQNELQKRLVFPYRWHKKQNDNWDTASNFIYSVPQWQILLDKIELKKDVFPGEEQEFFDYCINRWYNFYSAVAVEKIFTNIEGIKPRFNPKDRLVDFNFFGINFDHKTSVFPARFPNSLAYARKNPRKLILWLYQNQSRQQRKHFENRLFLIVFSRTGAHWKLKSEIFWLKSVIEEYVATFEASQLMELEFEPGKKVVSGIIWAVK